MKISDTASLHQKLSATPAVDTLTYFFHKALLAPLSSAQATRKPMVYALALDTGLVRRLEAFCDAFLHIGPQYCRPLFQNSETATTLFQFLPHLLPFPQLFLRLSEVMIRLASALVDALPFPLFCSSIPIMTETMSDALLRACDGPLFPNMCDLYVKVVQRTADESMSSFISTDFFERLIGVASEVSKTLKRHHTHTEERPTRLSPRGPAHAQSPAPSLSNDAGAPARAALLDAYFAREAHNVLQVDNLETAEALILSFPFVLLRTKMKDNFTIALAKEATVMELVKISGRIPRLRLPPHFSSIQQYIDLPPTSKNEVPSLKDLSLPHKLLLLFALEADETLIHESPSLEPEKEMEYPSVEAKQVATPVATPRSSQARRRSQFANMAPAIEGSSHQLQVMSPDFVASKDTSERSRKLRFPSILTTISVEFRTVLIAYNACRAARTNLSKLSKKKKRKEQNFCGLLSTFFSALEFHPTNPIRLDTAVFGESKPKTRSHRESIALSDFSDARPFLDYASSKVYEERVFGPVPVNYQRIAKCLPFCPNALFHIVSLLPFLPVSSRYIISEGLVSIFAKTNQLLGFRDKAGELFCSVFMGYRNILVMLNQIDEGIPTGPEDKEGTSDPFSQSFLEPETSNEFMRWFVGLIERTVKSSELFINQLKRQPTLHPRRPAKHSDRKKGRKLRVQLNMGESQIYANIEEFFLYIINELNKYFRKHIKEEDNLVLHSCVSLMYALSSISKNCRKQWSSYVWHNIRHAPPQLRDELIQTLDTNIFNRATILSNAKIGIYDFLRSPNSIDPSVLLPVFNKLFELFSENHNICATFISGGMDIPTGIRITEDEEHKYFSTAFPSDPSAGADLPAKHMQLRNPQPPPTPTSKYTSSESAPQPKGDVLTIFCFLVRFLLKKANKVSAAAKLYFNTALSVINLIAVSIRSCSPRKDVDAIASFITKRPFFVFFKNLKPFITIPKRCQEIQDVVFFLASVSTHAHKRKLVNEGNLVINPDVIAWYAKQLVAYFENNQKAGLPAILVQILEKFIDRVSYLLSKTEKHALSPSFPSDCCSEFSTSSVYLQDAFADDLQLDFSEQIIVSNALKLCQSHLTQYLIKFFFLTNVPSEYKKTLHRCILTLIDYFSTFEDLRQLISMVHKSPHHTRLALEACMFSKSYQPKEYVFVQSGRSLITQKEQAIKFPPHNGWTFCGWFRLLPAQGVDASDPFTLLCISTNTKFQQNLRVSLDVERTELSVEIGNCSASIALPILDPYSWFHITVTGRQLAKREKGSFAAFPSNAFAQHICELRGCLQHLNSNFHDTEQKIKTLLKHAPVDCVDFFPRKPDDAWAVQVYLQGVAVARNLAQPNPKLKPAQTGNYIPKLHLGGTSSVYLGANALLEGWASPSDAYDLFLINPSGLPTDSNEQLDVSPSAIIPQGLFRPVLKYLIRNSNLQESLVMVKVTKLHSVSANTLGEEYHSILENLNLKILFVFYPRSGTYYNVVYVGTLKNLQNQSLNTQLITGEPVASSLRSNPMDPVYSKSPPSPLLLSTPSARGGISANFSSKSFTSITQVSVKDWTSKTIGLLGIRTFSFVDVFQRDRGVEALLLGLEKLVNDERSTPEHFCAVLVLLRISTWSSSRAHSRLLELEGLSKITSLVKKDQRFYESPTIARTLISFTGMLISDDLVKDLVAITKGEKEFNAEVSPFKTHQPPSGFVLDVKAFSDILIDFGLWLCFPEHVVCTVLEICRYLVCEQDRALFNRNLLIDMRRALMYLINGLEKTLDRHIKLSSPKVLKRLLDCISKFVASKIFNSHIEKVFTAQTLGSLFLSSFPPDKLRMDTDLANIIIPTHERKLIATSFPLETNRLPFRSLGLESINKTLFGELMFPSFHRIRESSPQTPMDIADDFMSDETTSTSRKSLRASSIKQSDSAFFNKENIQLISFLAWFDPQAAVRTQALAFLFHTLKFTRGSIKPHLKEPFFLLIPPKLPFPDMIKFRDLAFCDKFNEELSLEEIDALLTILTFSAERYPPRSSLATPRDRGALARNSLMDRADETVSNTFFYESEQSNLLSYLFSRTARLVFPFVMAQEVRKCEEISEQRHFTSSEELLELKEKLLKIFKVVSICTIPSPCDDPNLEDAIATLLHLLALIDLPFENGDELLFEPTLDLEEPDWDAVIPRKHLIRFHLLNSLSSVAAKVLNPKRFDRFFDTVRNSSLWCSFFTQNEVEERNRQFESVREFVCLVTLFQFSACSRKSLLNLLVQKFEEEAVRREAVSTPHSSDFSIDTQHTLSSVLKRLPALFSLLGEQIPRLRKQMRAYAGIQQKAFSPRARSVSFFGINEAQVDDEPITSEDYAPRRDYFDGQDDEWKRFLICLFESVVNNLLETTFSLALLTGSLLYVFYKRVYRSHLPQRFFKREGLGGTPDLTHGTTSDTLNTSGTESCFSPGPLIKVTSEDISTRLDKAFSVHTETPSSLILETREFLDNIKTLISSRPSQARIYDVLDKCKILPNVLLDEMQKLRVLFSRSLVLAFRLSSINLSSKAMLFFSAAAPTLQLQPYTAPRIEPKKFFSKSSTAVPPTPRSAPLPPELCKQKRSAEQFAFFLISLLALQLEGPSFKRPPQAALSSDQIISVDVDPKKFFQIFHSFLRDVVIALDDAVICEENHFFKTFYWFFHERLATFWTQKLLADPTEEYFSPEPSSTTSSMRTPSLGALAQSPQLYQRGALTEEKLLATILKDMRNWSLHESSKDKARAAIASPFENDVSGVWEHMPATLTSPLLEKSTDRQARPEALARRLNESSVAPFEIVVPAKRIRQGFGPVVNYSEFVDFALNFIKCSRLRLLKRTQKLLYAQIKEWRKAHMDKVAVAFLNPRYGEMVQLGLRKSLESAGSICSEFSVASFIGIANNETLQKRLKNPKLKTIQCGNFPDERIPTDVGDADGLFQLDVPPLIQDDAIPSIEATRSVFVLDSRCGYGGERRRVLLRNIPNDLNGTPSMGFLLHMIAYIQQWNTDFNNYQIKNQHTDFLNLEQPIPKRFDNTSPDPVNDKAFSPITRNLHIFCPFWKFDDLDHPIFKFSPPSHIILPQRVYDFRRSIPVFVENYLKNETLKLDFTLSEPFVIFGFKRQTVRSSWQPSANEAYAKSPVQPIRQEKDISGAISQRFKAPDIFFNFICASVTPLATIPGEVIVINNSILFAGEVGCLRVFSELLKEWRAEVARQIGEQYKKKRKILRRFGGVYSFLNLLLEQTLDQACLSLNNPPQGNWDKSGRYRKATIADDPSLARPRQTRIHMSAITAIHKRVFANQPLAVEIFTCSGSSYFFAFDCSLHADLFVQAILEQGTYLTMLRYTPNKSEEYLKDVTAQWRSGELSNFGYITELNTLAGRTFCDLAQYPVFPNVLAAYDSDSVPDLSSPDSFRNFAYPMGGQNDARFARFVERQKHHVSIGAHDIDGKWLYATHYSHSNVAPFLLSRIEPFTSAQRVTQNGKFDETDRMFFSLTNLWIASSQSSTQQVIELVPEFFNLPEALVNLNNMDLGYQSQYRRRVNDVMLPLWAASADFFVAFNRHALESPFASMNLQHWVSLVFGELQRSKELRHRNIFPKYTYQGEVDMCALSADERMSAFAKMLYFGQTPRQLFASGENPRIDDRILRRLGQALTSWESILPPVRTEPEQPAESKAAAASGSESEQAPPESETARTISPSVSSLDIRGGYNRHPLSALMLADPCRFRTEAEASMMPKAVRLERAFESYLRLSRDGRPVKRISAGMALCQRGAFFVEPGRPPTRGVHKPSQDKSSSTHLTFGFPNKPYNVFSLIDASCAVPPFGVCFLEYCQEKSKILLFRADYATSPLAELEPKEIGSSAITVLAAGMCAGDDCEENIGVQLYAGTDEGTIVSWNLTTGLDYVSVDPADEDYERFRLGFRNVFRGHDSRITCMETSIEWGLLVSGDERGGVFVWDTTTDSLLFSLNPRKDLMGDLNDPTIPCAVQRVAISPVDGTIAVAVQQKESELFALTYSLSGTFCRRIELAPDAPDSVSALTFVRHVPGRDTPLLIIGTLRGRLHFVDPLNALRGMGRPDASCLLGGAADYFEYHLRDLLAAPDAKWFVTLEEWKERAPNAAPTLVNRARLHEYPR
eukprot:gnl/Chilomastix_cuspidata/2908.p1 GENE.gnl/Chilomastix_cuspidata/2908~~gnl/Chilomastix_cuspidata/2908.p1  ORF type:complete len:4175 (+),score=1135.47 gnl/Chilomastix_cuspidata/2908:177-12527(+)